MKRRSIIIVLLVAVLMLCSCTSADSGSRRTALKIGPKVIDNIEFQYAYTEAINSFYNQNYQYLAMMGIDFSKDISDQELSEGMTWKKYFTDTAIGALAETYYLCLEAQENGYTLPEKYQEELDLSFSEFNSELEDYGMTLEQYLDETYGNGMTIDDFVEYVTNDAIAYYYYRDVVNGIPVSEEALDSHYQENKKNYDTVDFSICYFAYGSAPEGSVREDGTVDESYKMEAKALAEATLANINDPSEFEDYCKTLFTEEEIEERGGEGFTSVSAMYEELFPDLSNWLFDDSRVYADETVLEYNNGYFAVMFNNRHLETYNTVSVRHILIKTPEVAEVFIEGTEEVDVAATQAAQEASDAEMYAKAESILNTWLEGDATEASFAALADAHSEDVSDGGFYNNFLKGKMVKEFETWSFDEARVPGDYGIVKTVYGYHIMYFVSEDAPHWENEAKKVLQQAEYENIYDEYAEKYPIVAYDSVIDKVKW